MALLNNRQDWIPRHEEQSLNGVEELSRIDLYGPDVIADPYPIYHLLREAGPVVTVGGIKQVTTFEQCDRVLKDTTFGRGAYEQLIKKAIGDGPLYESLRRWILYLDPPDHTRLRGLVMRAFTPRAVARLRERIAEFVDRLVDDLICAVATDFLSSFAYLLPVYVICELLGVPREDRDEFRTWSTDLGRGLVISAMSPEVVLRGNEAASRINDYVCALIVDRRHSPQGGFLDDLIAAEDDSGKLSNDELVATVVLLFFAGHETTVNLMGNGTLALLRAPTQWKELCANPSLASSAVEEMLRIDTPVQRASRIALAETTLAGQVIKQGEMINILIAGANRDPARFANPDQFIVNRADGPHLSFAAGPHYCVGASLARVEAQIALAGLATRVPGLRLATDEPVFRPNAILRGLETLPVSIR
jgi:pimeloyl-[acyl-carrier protein] synthase